MLCRKTCFNSRIRPKTNWLQNLGRVSMPKPDRLDEKARKRVLETWIRIDVNQDRRNFDSKNAAFSWQIQSI
jgi:hypothetical protein